VFALPYPLLMLIAPLATPKRLRTAASFSEMFAVEARPSSVLTWLSEIAPLLGNGIDYSTVVAQGIGVDCSAACST
jgi:hypothetical protein